MSWKFLQAFDGNVMLNHWIPINMEIEKNFTIFSPFQDIFCYPFPAGHKLANRYVACMHITYTPKPE